jgi:hypothetical protein
MACRRLLFAVLLAAPSIAAADDPLPSPAEQEKARAAEDERLLRDASIAIDDAGLLTFLRDRSLDEAERKKMQALVLQLGSDDFEEREAASRALVGRGRLAVPFLKDGLGAKDVEAVRRAKDCLIEIDRGPGPALPAAAVRMLARRHPDGAVEVLLRFLPFADDETLEDETFAALARCGLRDGKVDPLLVKARSDVVGPRRAAAGHVLARADAASRDEAVRLLADADDHVRFRTAQGLLAARDKRSVPALLALLGNSPPELSWRVEDILYRLAGEKAPMVSSGTTDRERKAWQDAWKTWWDREGDKVDLARVDAATPFLHVLLVPEMHGQKIWEVDRSGKQLWKLDNPNVPREAALTPNGHVLVAEVSTNRVAEYDRAGKMVWSYAFSDPAYLQRLPNGNTFIGNHQKAVEVTPGGKEVFSYQQKDTSFFIHSMYRKRDANLVLLSMAGKLMEVTPKGDEVVSFQLDQNNRNWCGVEGLPGRRYLCVCINNGEVIEVDATGKTLWSCKINGASYASRLPNGNTMICSFNDRRVVVVDRGGTIVWEQKVGSTPWRAHMR